MDTSRELPPIETKFRLGKEVTDEQLAFLDHYGFLHFEGVASEDEVKGLLAEHARVARSRYGGR